MTDLVQRDGLDVPFAAFAGSGDRPGERGVEEDVGLEELAGHVVDEEARGRQHAIERGSLQESERRQAIVVAGQARGEAGELVRDRGGRHSLPGCKGVSRRRLEIGRGHAGHALIGDEVANRRRASTSASPAAPFTSKPNLRYASAGGACRRPARRQEQHARRAERVAMPIMAAFRPARARRARSRASGDGRRPSVPRTIGPIGRRQQRRRRHHPVALADCASRKTPWLSPSTYGTVGPSTAEKHDHALADGELRRADDDAAVAAQRAAGHAKLHDARRAVPSDTSPPRA